MGTEIKVLMVGPDRGVHGGISAVVNELYAAGLDREVSLKYIGTMKEGSKLKKLLVAAFAYWRFCGELSWCDVVHIHFSSDSSFMRKSFFIKRAKKSGKKIVLHQHGGDFKTYYNKELDEAGRKNLKEILDMGDVLLVLTQGWKEFFGQIIAPEKITVLSNGISVSDYVNNDNTAGEKDFNSVLFLGRICRDKGVDELLDAMKKIHEVNDKAHLYVGGIYEDSLYKEKVEACRDFVTYIGWVTGEDKNKYLDKCGILALPSYFEGFGMVIIEALLHRCAVVASAVGGIPEIIDEGVDGYLFPPKDTKAVKDALEKVMENHENAAAMGQRGQKKVIERYSVEENIKKLKEIYRKICD